MPSPCKADETRTGRRVSENSCFPKAGLAEACGQIRFWIAPISEHLASSLEDRLVGRSGHDTPRLDTYRCPFTKNSELAFPTEETVEACLWNICSVAESGSM